MSADSLIGGRHPGRFIAVGPDWRRATLRVSPVGGGVRLLATSSTKKCWAHTYCLPLPPWGYSAAGLLVPSSVLNEFQVYSMYYHFSYYYIYKSPVCTFMIDMTKG
jgi:hypothetical protein